MAEYKRKDMPEDMPALLSLLKDDPCFARHAETPEGRELSARAADDDKVTGHHAIIITENIPGKLPLDEQNLYRMVAGRMLEAFSGDCTKEEADVRIECGGILFEAGYRRTVHAGWKNVHDGTGKEEDTMFPSWGQDEVLPVTDISVRSVETCPVPLFTEASLLSEMERCGLGTPSTRAGVIELLIARRYVERQGCGLLPTPKGLEVYEAVRDKLIADPEMTARWEKDLQEIDHRLATLQLRGVKGTTGTQASFMELFKGDADKIRAVDASIAEEMGFDCEAVIPVSGQTYSRKVDAFILNALAGIGQSCMKFATDLRLLANFKEMEEPFEKNQIGSSAMPYKRNPMRCERICALSRYLMVDVLNPSFTTGTQWFERTLDDSANKRVAMAEGFLATDAILNIMLNVTDGLVVYPKVVRSRLMAELPFMASENIMMQAVEKGGNRQELHERLRQHAIAAGKQVKEEGLPNDMVDRIAADPAFGLTKEEITAGLVPENFVGRAPQQVEEFIAHILKPIFDANPDAVEQHANLSV